jgi:NAD(P)-dependent dehydrogenase (short-subunit alcohol dehydrogenase family)
MPSDETPAEDFPGRVEIEDLDINQPRQLASLRERLSGRSFDMLFVNAGTTNNEQVPIGQVPTEDFADVMITNW